MGFSIPLIVLGVLSASGLIIEKRPDAKELIDKLRPYQGWIGVVCAFYGAWGLVSSVLNLGWLGSHPLWWIAMAASSAAMLGNGFLLGYSLAMTWVKDEAAKAKAAEAFKKLQPMQTKLGLAAIGIGVVGTVMFIL